MRELPVKEIEQAAKDLQLPICQDTGIAVETHPTHIAGLPLAVTVGCYVTRHATKIL